MNSKSLEDWASELGPVDDRGFYALDIKAEDVVNLLRRVFAERKPARQGDNLRRQFIQMSGTNTRLFSTLIKDIETGNPAVPTIAAGTHVQIWTTSRFGWIGVSTVLDETCIGYEACVGGPEPARNPGLAEDYLTDLRHAP